MLTRRATAQLLATTAVATALGSVTGFAADKVIKHSLAKWGFQIQKQPIGKELSAAKRKAILRWLREPGPDGKPRKGTPPPPRPPVAPAVAERASQPALAGPPLRGGRALAASRRLMLRNRVG